MYSIPSIARVKSLKKEPFLPMRCFTKTKGIVMSTYVHSQNMEGGLYTFGREKQFHDAVIAMSIYIQVISRKFKYLHSTSLLVRRFSPLKCRFRMFGS